MFKPAIDVARKVVKKKFFSPQFEPLKIAADSTLEALAFLHCLFSVEDPDFYLFHDRIIVFKNPETFANLISNPTYFIAVATNREVERELAPYIKNFRSIIIYPRNATNANPDVILEPLGYRAFDSALKEAGYSRDEINRLAHESGRSLSILRRRLSNVEAISTPPWSTDQQVVESLIPLLFAGTWDANNSIDRTIVEQLSSAGYSEIERNFITLLNREESPVWSEGGHCGVTSKIDILFSINRYVTKGDIERFLTIAESILSEDDPSLDLSEDQRVMAGILGKIRDVSKHLRNSICETVVLLAIHGNDLFKKRTNIDFEYKINELIGKLLTPFTLRKLEAHSYDLPLYAEAAPQKFIELMEYDLDSNDPQSILLMRPITGTFGPDYRAGLLWALENLAWSQEYLSRIVLILGRLSQQFIGDNWSNTPRASLSVIFHSWMPQTAASVDQRIAAFDLLSEKFPDTAWGIFKEQFSDRISYAHYSHKPRWRKYGFGYGEPLPDGVDNKFRRHLLERALSWKQCTRDNIGDLISIINAVSETYQTQIWNLVENWVKNAIELDRSWVKEKIRANTFTRRAQKRLNITSKILAQVQSIYDSLTPSNIILKHEWLFRKQWIDESIDNVEEEYEDFRKRDQRIHAMRCNALKEVYDIQGMPGILSLAEMGEAYEVIGSLLSQILDSTTEFIDVIRYILNCGSLSESKIRKGIVYGALYYLPKDKAALILPNLFDVLNSFEAENIATLCPFNDMTWQFIALRSEQLQNEYWKNVHPNWPLPSTREEQHFAAEKLLEVDRPRAAFFLISSNIEDIYPKLVYSILQRITVSSNEPTEMYRIDSYRICSAFDRLNKSQEIPIVEMAGLKFRYLEILDQEDYKISNLEKHIEAHPELFVQAIVFAYKRDDNAIDPIEYQSSTDQEQQSRAWLSYRLLEKLMNIPGQGHSGNFDADKFELWVNQVRSECKRLARDKVCDLSIGKIFAKTPIGDDNIWPCQPVREILEKIINKDIMDGITTGLYSARGAHWRGEGGEQERELAEKYKNWSDALEFTYPKISRAISKMVRTYQREGDWQDTEAMIRKQLGE